MDEVSYSVLYLVIATVFAIVLYIWRSVYYSSKGIDVPTSIGQYSIKFHYFVWFFVIPLYASNLLHEYIQIDLPNFFPLNIISIGEFICFVLLVAAFIGFFKYAKYSWYCIEAFNILNAVLQITILFICDYYEIDINIVGVLGILVSRLIIFVYYYKRKSIFNYQIKRRITNQENNDDFEQIDQNGSDENCNEFSTETYVYCRKCGEKLVSGTKFCRKCGTKIYDV